MPQLIFRYDDGGEEIFPLQDDQIGVGRGSDNPIVIDHDFISTHHARLKREGDGYRVFDLGSNNGTYVNDQAITSARLRHGDTLRFGVFEVLYSEVPGESAGNGSFAAVPDATIDRLEARRAELQDRLVEEHQRLAELRERLVPAAEAELSICREELQRETASLGQVRGALGESMRLMEATRGEHQAFLTEAAKERAAVEQIRLEREVRQSELTDTVKELLDAEAAREDALARLDEMRSIQVAAEATLSKTRAEHEQLVARNKATITALHESEEAAAVLKRRIEADTETRQTLGDELEQLRQRLSQTRDRLEMAEARLKGRIRDWNEFESGQLTLIVERKSKLEDQCTAAETRLSRARDELADTRERLRKETETTEAGLHELRVNHYEPTKELHAELTLRNEELANEVARKEERLRYLETAIRESRETEKLVTRNLEEKGQTLGRLENQIGEEVSRIAATVISLQRPASAAKPPRLADLGDIFGPTSGPPPTSFRPVSRNAPGKTSLTVFDPASQARSMDCSMLVELDIEAAPLPVGFMGLAAATRGAFFTSLARTVEANRPVLLIAGDDLEETHAHLKKLRAAMPSQTLLLGWRASTFVKVTESLHEGTNFQDLVAMLGMSDGSVTSDPYMNTFFDSLNQGKRFLYLPPALPWNPKPRPPHSARAGIYVDIASFQADDSRFDPFVSELKGIVESTRQLLTIPEVSRARARRFLERLDLGADWTRVIPVPEYPELLGLLGKHLAAVSLETTDHDHPMLRDVLLTGTILLAPGSEAYQTFFPAAADSAREARRTLADAAWVAGVFDDGDRYDVVVRHAEKALLEHHSYQAAAKRLDAFMATMRR